MSGGIIGTVGVTIGAVAGLPAIIVASGSIAAAEQIHLAKECTIAVQNAKAEREKMLAVYQKQSSAVVKQMQTATQAEIRRLTAELQKRGIPIPVMTRQDDDALLLKLLELELFGGRPEVSVKSKQKGKTVRTPTVVFKSICGLIDPLLMYIPTTTPEGTELTSIKQRASKIGADATRSAEEKARALCALESQLLADMTRYRRISKKHEYALAQFASLSFAHKKLCQACGEEAVERRLNPANADAQIAYLQCENMRLRDKLKARMTQDPAYIKANQLLAKQARTALAAAGYQTVSVRSESYGEVSLHTFEKSLIKMTVSKEGVLSMDLVGKKGESKSQVLADEKIFCSKGLPRIQKALTDNGIALQIDHLTHLTAESVRIEEDEAYRYRNDRRIYDTAPQAMYADDGGGRR